MVSKNAVLIEIKTPATKLLGSEYRQNIYHMALGKWAMMPQSKHQGGKRPELLTLNRLYELEDMVSGHAFAAMSRNLQDFHAVTQLQALEWLKADKDDNNRVKDNISIDKVSILETNATKVDSYVGEDDVGAPVGQQTEILRIMYENHFAENEIEDVRLSFQTTNVLDKQKIRKLIRSVMRDKKSNKPCLEQIRKLVAIAKQTLSEDEDKKELHNVKQVLFYVRGNS